MSKHIKDTCKIGQGNDCCRYLMMGPKGFECAKFGAAKSLLDARARNKDMVAQADNCDGYSEQESINYLNQKA